VLQFRLKHNRDIFFVAAPSQTTDRSWGLVRSLRMLGTVSATTTLLLLLIIMAQAGQQNAEAVRAAYLEKLHSIDIVEASAKDFVICGCPKTACVNRSFFDKQWVARRTSQRHWHEASQDDPVLQVPSVAWKLHTEKYTTPDLYMDLYALHLGGMLGASVTDDRLHVEALQGVFTEEQHQFLRELKQLPTDTVTGGLGGALVAAAAAAGAGAGAGAGADAGGALGGGDYQVRATCPSEEYDLMYQLS
jgi:hypothetical protein